MNAVPYGPTGRAAWFGRTGARTRTNSQGVGLFSMNEVGTGRTGAGSRIGLKGVYFW